MATLASYIAGSYSATLGPVISPPSLGDTEDGFEMEYSFFWENQRSDQLGDTVQDQLYRGAECFVNMILHEYAQVGKDAPTTRIDTIWNPPDGAGLGGSAVFGALGVPGASADPDTEDNQLILSPLHAIDTNFPEITAKRPVLAENFGIRLGFSTRLRRIPLRLRLLPYLVATVVTFFTEDTIP